MTKRRLEYLKGCSVVERFCREELRLAAKKIKMYKQDINGRVKRIADFDESDKYNIKICTDLLQISKGFLRIEQAKYKAIKKLLPIRKPAKKITPIKNAGYWKVKPIKALVPGYIVCECSICGKEYATYEKEIEELYEVCPGCHRPMKSKGVTQ